jgi:hypothetical protein
VVITIVLVVVEVLASSVVVVLVVVRSVLVVVVLVVVLVVVVVGSRTWIRQSWPTTAPRLPTASALARTSAGSDALQRSVSPSPAGTPSTVHTIRTDSPGVATGVEPQDDLPRPPPTRCRSPAPGRRRAATRRPHPNIPAPARRPSVRPPPAGRRAAR